jgi:phosphoglycerate kinase
MLKTLNLADIKNKTILFRAPYDIETTQRGNEYVLKDTSRIKCTLESLNYLIQNDCKIGILTWVGRPETKTDEFSTKWHAKELSSMLNKTVQHIDNCVGEKVQQALKNLNPGESIMLENSRFHKEDLEENETFAKELCIGYDFIVFDGFPQAHRKHASTTGILKVLPSCAGFYFEKEYSSLKSILDNPPRPFTVIIGGAKIADKIDAIKSMSKKADIVLTGGGTANVFLKADRKNIGSSFAEEKSVDKNKQEINYLLEAKNLLGQKLSPELEAQYKINEDINLYKIMVPYDLLTAKSVNDSELKLSIAYKQINAVENGYAAYDIGPIACKIYKQIISQSQTVFWAGPLGVYENPSFENGTKTIAQAMSDNSGLTIIAGGDTIDSLNRLGNPNKIKHISLAGGATLDFISGKELPVLKYLVQD